MNIKTEYDPKPIPIRQFDWSAWDDDVENSYIGYGLTEQDAINDFLKATEDEITIRKNI